MKIENIRVYGFESALHDMRNPKESWDQSDSTFGSGYAGATTLHDAGIAHVEYPVIGPKDLNLACRLIKAGTDHRKFVRQIIIWLNSTIPRYIWQEKDTYKVATVRNSCSTMHKLGHRDLTLDDFQDGDVSPTVLSRQNQMGFCYRGKTVYTDHETDTTYEGNDLLIHMKRRLPEGFLQMAGYTFSYETALSMYGSRHNHRMPEWSGPGGICKTLLRLPYFKEFVEAAK